MLEWNVFIESINEKKIKEYNVFNNTAFLDDCKKAFRKYGKTEETRDELVDSIRTSAMYYYWCKCEWEVIITGWPPQREDSGFREKKVDVFSQLSLNWNRFIEYCIANKKEFLKREKKLK